MFNLNKKLVQWRKNNVKVSTSVEEFLKFNAQSEDEKIRRASINSIKKSFNKKDTLLN